MIENITPNFRGPSLKEILFFEFVSWYGRNFKKGKSRIQPTSEPLLLDFGCGANFQPGWVHVDFFASPKLKFWKKRQGKRPELEMDLRYPFNSQNNIADGVYSGHTIEHLYPGEAIQFLSEIFRILKPGAWLRINCPDLEKYIQYYLGNENHPNFLTFKTGCEAISMVTQNYGHHSSWDEKTFRSTLEQIGFCHVSKVAFGTEGSDKRLIKEEEGRLWETIVMEAQKPL